MGILLKTSWSVPDPSDNIARRITARLLSTGEVLFIVHNALTEFGTLDRSIDVRSQTPTVEQLRRKVVHAIQDHSYRLDNTALNLNWELSK